MEISQKFLAFLEYMNFKEIKIFFFIFCCSNPDADGNATDDNSGASGAAAQEVEIVFKLHPEMLADIAQKDAVKAMKDNATRYIKTTSRALVEHLCKYLAMRIALDLAKTTSAASTQGNLLRAIINWSGGAQSLVQSPKKKRQCQ